MADNENVPLLAPSEFSGDAGTCVVGRVVILRGPVDVRRATGDTGGVGSQASQGVGVGSQGSQGVPKGLSRGKQLGKRQVKDDGPMMKTEVHFLGGESMGEVLYMEAWGDAAAQVSSLLERGKVYRVQGARIMPQMPRFSTSRLDYYLRAGHIRVA